MINPKTKERELCYVTYIDRIEEIPGRDFTECAVIGGWKVLVRKGIFKPGDLGIYIEIDSKVPEKAPFEFLSKYHYKVKTQKFKQFYSQGLLMHPSDFGWHETFAFDKHFNNGKKGVEDNQEVIHFADDESRFLTKQLGITYAVADDISVKHLPQINIRKWLSVIQNYSRKTGLDG